MNRSQKIIWFLIAATLVALACATSMIDDALGARTLTRGALGLVTLVIIVHFWNEFPTDETDELEKKGEVHAR